MITWFIATCIVILFGAVVFRGAPYVPTHKQAIEDALDLLDLKKGDLVVDLGSGDGGFLRAAAKKGLRGIGFELNPVLVFVAWLRCTHLAGRVQFRVRDYWLTDFPPDTKAVFIFLAGPYMRRLRRKIDFEMTRRTQPLLVVSNGFAIPDIAPHKIKSGLYLYVFKPQK